MSSTSPDPTGTTKKSRWTHPIHARGVRSPDFKTATVKGVLTDAQIHKYAKLGHYGTENQSAAIAADKKKKTRVKRITLADALKALGC